MALNEVLDEIKDCVRKKHDDHVPAIEDKPPARKKGRKPMTKAEIEAYRQKMMEKEEARYLANEGSGKGGGERKKQRREKRKICKKEDGEAKKATLAIKLPKLIQPIEPLLMFKLPGLPKGDRVVLCIAHGVD